MPDIFSIIFGSWLDGGIVRVNRVKFANLIDEETPLCQTLKTTIRIDIC
ncbi:exosome complex RNA-binding protein Rrp4 [Pedobacter sp. AK017]|nr:exosome complex RNA-binding protein Rrp4 [Pedobacter sp. AK017]